MMNASNEGWREVVTWMIAAREAQTLDATTIKYLCSISAAGKNAATLVRLVIVFPCYFKGWWCIPHRSISFYAQPAFIVYLHLRTHDSPAASACLWRNSQCRGEIQQRSMRKFPTNQPESYDVHICGHHDILLVACPKQRHLSAND